VAKKVRTPPPPRRVQAPQRRETRRGGPPTGQRSPWLYAALGAGLALVVAAAAVGFALLRDDGGSSGTKTRTTSTDYNALPGVRKTKAPWAPEYEFLADRLLPLGLTQLPQEAAATHYHSHVDIFVDGKPVTVPANIGISATWLTELHTHDTRGVIHIESPEENDTFTLGQFVAEWGVYLDRRCVGAYCDNLRWYVNGVRQTGNPQNLVLEPHQQIALVVGKAPAKVPASYEFGRGE
jgi:hypothetical protein